MPPIDNKSRFTGLAEDYAKYRPTYPAAAIDTLVRLAELDSGAVIADVGSGTGKLTRLLLERGYTVLAVEPNASMRAAAEGELASFPNFRSVTGSAEETTLDSASVGLVTAAQAFHWFDKARCRVEFRRVLKPRGRVALIWNSRGGSSDFTREYRQITKNLRGANPREDGARTDSAEFAAFFGGDYTTEHFAWSEKLNFDALWGNERSRSTSPTPDHPNYAPLETALRALFERYQRGGAVEYEYVTEVAVGILQ